MSIITQNSTDEVALIDHIKKFFAKYQLGKLLKNVTAQRKKVFRQSSVFMLDFESRLPKYLQNALHPKPKTA